jgi:hypothetical protein
MTRMATVRRSPKAGRPPVAVKPSTRGRAPVRKDTTWLQTDAGPRARWSASKPEWKKR